MKQCYWLWYPGDLELYHAMRQNFSRVERGYGWPAFWKSEGFHHRVVFRRTYHLEKPLFVYFPGPLALCWPGSGNIPLERRLYVRQGMCLSLFIQAVWRLFPVSM